MYIYIYIYIIDTHFIHLSLLENRFYLEVNEMFGKLPNIWARTPTSHKNSTKASLKIAAPKFS